MGCCRRQAWQPSSALHVGAANGALGHGQERPAPAPVSVPPLGSTCSCSTARPAPACNTLGCPGRCRGGMCGDRPGEPGGAEGASGAHVRNVRFNHRPWGDTADACRTPLDSLLPHPCLAPEGQRGPLVVALGRVVEHHIQDHLDAAPVGGERRRGTVSRKQPRQLASHSSRPPAAVVEGCTMGQSSPARLWHSLTICLNSLITSAPPPPCARWHAAKRGQGQ